MRHWLRSYWLLMRWQALQMGRNLAVMVVLSALWPLIFVVGLTFLVPVSVGPALVFYATAAPTMHMATVGMVVVPQDVATARRYGAFDFMWSLPAPRLTFLAASLTVNLVGALPGALLGVVAAGLRFDLDLRIGPMLVLAFMLVALSSAAIGYAIGFLMPAPQLTSLVTNLILFGLFLFSPIAFPVERLPSWLAAVHGVLPVKYMADLVRETLVGAPVSALYRPLAVVGAWCLACLVLAQRVVRRRV